MPLPQANPHGIDGSAIGIDFGTTNSSVARVCDGRVELVEFANDSLSSRSLLYVERTSRGTLSTSGASAIANYLRAHDEGGTGRLIQSLKSYLSSRDLTGTEIFGRHYAFEDLIARIVTDLRLAAEKHFQQPITRATVGRPVRFVGAETAEDDAFAVSRLRNAFTRAGFEHADFELEPIAAAWKYGRNLAHEETILIGDFGGGTSDFSVVRLGGGGRQRVLGSAGLGFAGDAFDAKIVRHLVSPALGSESLARGMNKLLPAVPAWIYANLERWHYLSFLRTRNVLEILRSSEKRAIEPDKIIALRALIDEDLGYQLHQSVQRTKALLSQEPVAEFVFSGPNAGTLDLRTQVTRADFERWISPELARIASTIDQLLVDTGSSRASIDHVFLTGGTSFVPAVRGIFEDRFPGRVTTGGEFTSVAEGLALVAASRVT